MNELCARVAELLGKAAALWVPTCGMANLVAMLTFCEPRRRRRARVRLARPHVGGDGNRRARRLEPVLALGERTAGWIRGVVDELVAERRAALLVLENTHTRAGGTMLSVEHTEALAAAAKRHDCRVHLDGARLVNAAVALGVPLAPTSPRRPTPSRSRSTRASRRRSAPCSPGARRSSSAGRPDAATARRRERPPRGNRRRGGARRPGTMLDRVADDHRRARVLADRLGAMPGLVPRPGGGRDEHRPRRRHRHGPRPGGARAAARRRRRASPRARHRPHPPRHPPR